MRSGRPKSHVSLAHLESLLINTSMTVEQIAHELKLHENTLYNRIKKNDKVGQLIRKHRPGLRSNSKNAGNK